MQRVEPLTWSTGLVSWQVSPWDALVMVLAVAYLAGTAKRRRSGRPWPARRTGSFLAGLVTIVLAVNSMIGTYSDVLFSMHMVQHLMLIMVVAALLVAGLPLTLWTTVGTPQQQQRREKFLRSRAVGTLTHPALTFLLYTAVLVCTHLTPFLQLRLEHPALEHVEVALYLISGYLLFLSAIGKEPTRWQHFPYPMRLVLLAAGMFPDTLVGVVLMMTPRPVAPGFALAHPGWGPSVVADQHLAGAIMWFFGDATMAAFALVVVRLWLRSSGPESRFGTWLESARRNALVHSQSDTSQTDTSTSLRESGDVDSDDQALAAYNAMLSRLHQPSRHPRQEPDQQDRE